MVASTLMQAYKYPRLPHWRVASIHLGSDAHGTWLGVPAGSTGRRGAEPPVTFPHPFVKLFPPSGWWAMDVKAPPHDPELSVDICTPPIWRGLHIVETVDLDLDVVRLRDGSVHLLDEDEFDLHRRELSYPPDLVASARITAAEIMLAAEQHRPPFDSSALPWLGVLEQHS